MEMSKASALKQLEEFKKKGDNPVPVAVKPINFFLKHSKERDLKGSFESSSSNQKGIFVKRESF